MKKIFVKDLKTGEFIKDLFLVTGKAVSYKKDGNKYIVITVADKTGTIKGVAWDNVEKIYETLCSADYAIIAGNITEFNNSLQIVIKDVFAPDNDSIDSSDFIPSAKADVEIMFERLLKLIETINRPYLKKLLYLFFNDDNLKTRFKNAPAGKKMHHAYLGGLLEHSLSVGLLADKIAGHYKGIDVDLLKTGAILHDIGKIEEFNYQLFIDYSDSGRLLNHIIIGAEMISDKIRAVSDFPEKEALLLKHMIISHHGTREFGSPEPPKTIEAVILNYLDEIDSKVMGIRDFMANKDTVLGWSPYHKIYERHFYKADYTDNNG
ncbi:MAG: HD domain-containing protein [Deltaproteobacteria bacterium]|nr:HD domain-containing protein [Deltaproteobacteria bacterium]